MSNIIGFKGELCCLSNFHLCKISYENLIYPSVENAYNAAKIYIEGDLNATNIERKRRMFTSRSPSRAKTEGLEVEKRADWDEVKEEIMYELLKQKFTVYKDIRDVLISTGDDEIVVTNMWHDNYWGVCNCSACKDKEKHNKLGKMLMKLRAEINKDNV